MSASHNRHERRRAASLGSAAAVAQPATSAVRALLDRAAQLRDRGDLSGALQLCQQAVRLEPANPEVHFTAATILETGRDLRNAVDAYRHVLKLKPGFLPALVNCAACLTDLGELPEGVHLYRLALKVDPGSLIVRHNLAQALMRLRRPAEAVPHLRALAAARQAATDYSALAEALDVAGDREGALAAYSEALKRGAPAAPVQVLMARVELVRGNLDAARDHVTAALEADPNDGHAHLVIANNFAEREAIADRIAAAEAALARAEGKPVGTAAAPLRFALGRLNDRAGRFEEAFGHFETANALFADLHRGEDDRLEQRARTVMSEFTSEFLTERRDWGAPSEQPVFVFGLPRSGTTLLEQVLASHKDVAGLGERDLTGWLATYLQTPTRERVARACEAYLGGYPDEARAKRRVIDKSLGTYLEVGLILLTFPNARLINCLRHPLDMAFSAWSQYFAASAVVYTYSFDRLARHMRLYAELMGHWHRTVPGRVLDVRYDELVTAPEATARRCVEHLGLDWDPACLEFHKTRREVRTASITQVRRSLYREALGRWRNYHRHLAPLEAELKDIVAAYEHQGTYGWEAPRQ